MASGTDGLEPLRVRVVDLEKRAKAEHDRHAEELGKVMAELQLLKGVTERLDAQNVGLTTARPPPQSMASHYTRSVEWTIYEFAKKERSLYKGDSLWSPKFSAAGLSDLQLEFFPRGREKTTFNGFCSLFLWCPGGTRVRYQLRVGSFARAPDQDDYTTRIGHGHSNFCPMSPEIDRERDLVQVGVELMDVVGPSPEEANDPFASTLRLVPTTLETMVAKEAEAFANRAVQRVVWKITGLARRMKHMPRGAGLWSPLFSAGGVREILLEFYPCGSTNTVREGYCALYVRCPIGVSMTVTLFVGQVKKGPIKTTFESLSGKGLPDFCNLDEHINKEDDSIEVGIELRNQPSEKLIIES